MTAISLGGRLLGPSSGLPGSRNGPDQPAGRRRAITRHRIHCSLFDLAPGGVCLARPVTRPAGELLPHRFTLTWRRQAPPGGLLSVALSLASRPVGVTHHRVLRSPDFPLAAFGLSRYGDSSNIGQRPSGPLQSLPPRIAPCNGRWKACTRWRGVIVCGEIAKRRKSDCAKKLGKGGRHT